MCISSHGPRLPVSINVISSVPHWYTLIFWLIQVILLGFPEPLDSFAHRLRQLRKLAGTKDDQHNRQYEHQFPGTEISNQTKHKTYLLYCSDRFVNTTCIYQQPPQVI